MPALSHSLRAVGICIDGSITRTGLQRVASWEFGKLAIDRFLKQIVMSMLEQRRNSGTDLDDRVDLASVRSRGGLDCQV
jgi:hypothetical protein